MSNPIVFNSIFQLIGGRGNNLHEVECADGKKFLVSMPTKFRKNLWVKRGKTSNVSCELVIGRFPFSEIFCC